MQLKSLEITGFKSFAKKTNFVFDTPITAVVGPNGSGKSNVAEAFRWVLGEQSLKSLRGKRGEDLIFNGAAGGQKLSRAAVAIVFDNTDRQLPIDYAEVTIAREVFRDGTNDYSINGSKVRLRDIIELLSNVSLGTSGHHIISQGEADRILLANIYERKEMIEEALGLKIYQWKIAESEKKFAKTQNNIKEVESLRREIAPHIKFLQKQVEKIEKTTELRRELKSLYLQYFKKEAVYLEQVKDKLARESAGPMAELAGLEAKLADLSGLAASGLSDNSRVAEMAGLEQRLRERRQERDDLGRQLGRVEGKIEIKSERLGPREAADNQVINFSEVENFTHELEVDLERGGGANSLDRVKQIFADLRTKIRNFLASHSQGHDREELTTEINQLKQEKATIEERVKSLGEEEQKILNQASQLKSKLEAVREKARGAERELFELRAKKSELKSKLEALTARTETYRTEEAAFRREVDEAVALVDREILDYRQEKIDDHEPLTDRGEQENLRRRIERSKIRLEDTGVEGTDVLEEYKEVTTRDEFLAKELADLKSSETSLEQIMTDLKQKIDREFKTGLVKINTEFQTYFALMFGGGTAGLEVLAPEKRKKRGEAELDLEALESGIVPEGDDEEETREGVEINVNLPRKKIKGLEMLSGGERALTSIALLFAMSQVNPPPFLILDETDAALDEANSKKYGEMVQSLAKQTQLILITHNRETMSHAGILYGVTMGAEGVSRILSLRFEEATNYAK